MTVSPINESDIGAAAQASLADAREARAVGPRPGPEALRRAHLELLKLCLCDLAGASTQSVCRLDDGLIWSFDLLKEHHAVRAAGMDWPLRGLTMIGLTRLDDLQGCVESVVQDGIPGDLIEAGAWRGGASILVRATLNSLGADERTLWVADSFQGFPRPDDAKRDEHDLGTIDFLEAPLEDVKYNFARFGCEDGVRFVPGFFEDTLPKLGGGPWSLIRLDADSSTATRVALESLYPSLSIGGYVVVDDYGWLEECRQTVDEFRAENGINEPIEEVDFTCVRWRRETGTPVEPPPQPDSVTSDERPTPDAAAPPREARIPTYQELNLKLEIDQLRARVGQAEAEIARLRNGRRRLGRLGLGRLRRAAR
jgi:O-methyltransferase